MIKTNKGSVKFKGTGKELIADYATIGFKLRQVLPAQLVDKAVELSKTPLEEIEKEMKEKKSK